MAVPSSRSADPGGARLADRAAWCVATGFGIGHAPFASGTVGTIAAVAIHLAAWRAGGHAAVAACAVAVCLIGIPAAGRLERRLGYHDPSEVVVDEVAGYLVTMILIEPTVATVAAGFVLFRALDILKPWPAAPLERLPGGYGILGDDVACGVLANVILQAGVWLWR